MFLGGSVGEIALGTGRGVGAGVAFWGGLRFLRWGIEFVARRQDVRAAQLDAREQALEAKFNARLAHVERELEQYREATMVLVNALFEHDPKNPVLVDVARILRGAIPRDKMTDEFAELTRQAGAALDAEGGGHDSD